MASQSNASQLKIELKAWERTFTAANQGRRPTKADIKNDPAIAIKYKQYDELCRPHRKANTTPKKSKQLRPVEPQQVEGTPQAQRLSAQLSPFKALSPTPQAIRQRLGPTPQKDGQILSLFEALDAFTPSKSRHVLTEVDGNVAATPSRKGQQDESNEETESKRFGRTPTSSGKRYMLDTFATPMKRKREEAAQTPTAARDVLATPQFLQRTSTLFKTGLDTVNEVNEPEAGNAVQPPFKKRGFVRSLSSIIKGLKSQEVEKADEDWDLLHDIESGSDPKPTHTATAADSQLVEETQVEDSGADGTDMPLGPDMLPLSDDEDGAADPGALDAEGRPRKVWKKKGLKRQTRKVKMRPATRAPFTTDDPVSFEQVLREAAANNADNDSASDSDDSDENTTKKKGKPDGDKPSKLRKIKASAHANFCKLKIKNKNSKAKGRGRFGRR